MRNFTYPVEPKIVHARLDTSTYVTERIEELERIGLFGIERDDIIENLVRERIRQLEVDGWFSHRGGKR